MPTLEETIRFIKTAHAGQVDKSYQPYFLHPIAVASRLGPDATDDERIVALLHDVIEDTGTTAQDLIGMGYAAAIVESVQRLSRPEGPDRPTYMDWIRSIAASGDRTAIKVKIADNEENSDPKRLAALPPHERDIVKRYQRSLAILRPALARIVND